MNDMKKTLEAVIDGARALPPALTSKILDRIYSEPLEVSSLSYYFLGFKSPGEFSSTPATFETFDGFLEVSETGYNGEPTGGLVIYSLSWPEETDDIYETDPDRKFVAACKATVGEFIRVFWITGEPLNFSDTWSFPAELYSDLLQIVTDYQSENI